MKHWLLALLLLSAERVWAAGQSSADYRIAADSLEGTGNIFNSPVASSQSYAQSQSATQLSNVGTTTSTNYRMVAGYQATTHGLDSDFDGVADDLVADADGDGVPNASDARPFDLDEDDLTTFAEVYGITGYFTDPELIDHDGDGSRDWVEILAGTNPLNLASVFRITAITRLGNDMQITWSSVGGKSYRLQAGSAAVVVSDINTTITAGGIGETVSSDTDIGGATNQPTRIYRVRLAP